MGTPDCDGSDMLDTKFGVQTRNETIHQSEIGSFWEDSPCNPRKHHIVARVIEVQGCFTPFSFNFKGSTGFTLHFFLGMFETRSKE